VAQRVSDLLYRTPLARTARKTSGDDAEQLGVLFAPLHCTCCNTTSPQAPHLPHRYIPTNRPINHQPTNRRTQCVSSTSDAAGPVLPASHQAQANKQASAANLPCFGRKTASASQAPTQMTPTHPKNTNCNPSRSHLTTQCNSQAPGRQSNSCYRGCVHSSGRHGCK
jgi:hypothetical protein